MNEEGSEAFEEPGVGIGAGFPDGEMASVGRGDGPAQIFFRFLEEGLGAAAQVNVQERLHAGWRRSGNPDSASVGGPVKAGDAGPVLQCESAILAISDGKKANVAGTGNMRFLGQGES